MDSSSSDDRIIGKSKREEEVDEKESFKKSKNEEDEQQRSSESESPNKTVKSESNIKDLLDDALDIILMKMKVEDEQVRNSYIKIKRSFGDHDFMSNKFDEAENLIAYIYGYALYNTELSLNRFRDAFQNCQELKEAIRRPNLNVISLGGGPGTDVVAFCSALEENLELIGSTKNLESHNSSERSELTSSFKSFNITIVDLFKRYASLYNIIEYLIREGDYGNVSTLFKTQDIVSSFMKVDLFEQYENQPQKYKGDLASADIVLLVRVADCLNFKRQSPRELLQEIVLRMKEGALLLRIDTVKDIWEITRFTEKYRSSLEEYRLPVQLKERFSFKTDINPSSAQIYVLQKI